MTASVPQIPKISIFSLGGASYIEDIVNIKIVPVDPEESQIVTLDGVVHKDVGVTSWQIELTAVQDWDSARPGLAWYCWTNQGTTKTFILKHELGTEAAGTPKFTGSCVIKALGYMGDGGVFATTDAVFPITGTLTLDATP
jgi:hypothetical protein